MVQSKGRNQGGSQGGPRGTGNTPCRGAGNRGSMSGRNCGQPGECVCPECGTRTPHEPGAPCLQVKCPQCGSPMVRA